MSIRAEEAPEAPATRTPRPATDSGMYVEIIASGTSTSDSAVLTCGVIAASSTCPVRPTIVCVKSDSTRTAARSAGRFTATTDFAVLQELDTINVAVPTPLVPVTPERFLLRTPDNYQVVFLGGGASLGFHMVPLNYMKVGGKSAYTNTGEWATRAIKESKLVGDTVVVASSEDKNFSYIPEFEVPTDVDYFHFTSNNTIFGTQYKHFPNSGVPLICDMSSDIFSRPVNVADFALIYGGAQKNMGPAGATVYLFDPNQLGKTGRKLSPMMDLKNHAASLLLKAIDYKDESMRMPPKGKLPDKDIAVLRKWVGAGLPYPADKLTAKAGAATVESAKLKATAVASRRIMLIPFWVNDEHAASFRVA